MRWFSGLPPQSITSFTDLVAAFEFQFATNKTKHLEVADLFDIKQIITKTLKQYWHDLMTSWSMTQIKSFLLKHFKRESGWPF
ncbi:hypothetical protein CR513_07868, partial [Mucuna pruriens]